MQHSQTATPCTACSISLLVQIQGEDPIILCTLCAGATDTVLLDQYLDEYAELSLRAAGADPPPEVGATLAVQSMHPYHLNCFDSGNF